MRVMLPSNFTTKWLQLMELVMDTNGGLLITFFVMDTNGGPTSLHPNDRRHIRTPTTVISLAKQVDQKVRNRCLSFMQQGNIQFAGGLSLGLPRDNQPCVRLMKIDLLR